MMAYRWLLLALALVGLAGCSQPADAPVDTSTPAYKDQAERVEQYKSKQNAAAQRGSRPTR